MPADNCSCLVSTCNGVSARRCTSRPATPPTDWLRTRYSLNLRRVRVAFGLSVVMVCVRGVKKSRHLPTWGRNKDAEYYRFRGSNEEIVVSWQRGDKTASTLFKCLLLYEFLQRLSWLFNARKTCSIFEIMQRIYIPLNIDYKHWFAIKLEYFNYEN